ncbi:MAG: hypothetical protein A2W98_08465 [Bacteroidetes bacterium GWF2_33_38]|nr:MAG: hypothetical protein A2W98_08465 [Bacteroidetes bacterium GWF2_33_38]OFY68038.1 MAG: hypothetical protein A2265_06755 [Bacteroidetes bacterium RIFOXYA12_FULL_33_9]
MKKFLKIFGIVILLMIATIVALPFIFKDKIKDIVVEQINENINALVTFDGFDLSLISSFPDFNFELNKLMVVGVDTFKNDTLVKLDKLSIGIDFMSIFGDEYKVNSIIIDHANINAIVLKDGKANWDIAKESGDVEDSTSSEEPTVFKLKLNQLSINNATIVYDDRSLDFYTLLENMNFSLNGDMTQDITTLNTLTSIEKMTMLFEGVKYFNQTAVNFDAKIETDLLKSKYTFSENILKLNQLELQFAGFIEMPTDDIGMDITFNAPKTEFKNILSLVPAVYMTDFETLKSSGKLALNGFAKGIYNDNSLPAYNIKLLIENGMFQYPDLPKSVNNVQVAITVDNKDGVDDHMVIDISKFHVEMAKNPFDIKMLIQTPISDPQIAGTINGTIDFNSVKEFIPLDDSELKGVLTANLEIDGRMSTIEQEKYEEFKAKGTIALNNFFFKSVDLPQGMTINHTEMEFTPKYLDLKSFSSKIGSSDISMTGKIENFLAYTFRDEVLKGDFTFTSTYFNVNEFMTDDEGVIDTASSEESELTVYEVPANIDFKLNSTIGKTIYDNITISNLSGIIVIKDGKIIMDNVSMNLLDGKVSMSGEYNTQNMAKPYVDFNMEIEKLDIQKSFKTFNTIQKLAPIAENCQGKFSTQMTYKSNLLPDMMPDMNSINSSGRLQTHNIVISNSKTFTKIADALKSDKFKKAEFNDFDLFFKIINGKVTIDPFKTSYSKTDAMIGGYSTLNQELNYTINLNIPRKEFGTAANDVLNNLTKQAASKGINIETSENINVNVLIGGTLLDPKISLDLKDQAKDAMQDLKDKAKAELERQKEELERKAKAEADRLKKKAQAEAERLKQEAAKKSKEAQEKARLEAERLKKQAQAEAERLKKEAEEKAKEEAKKRLNGLF